MSPDGPVRSPASEQINNIAGSGDVVGPTSNPNIAEDSERTHELRPGFRPTVPQILHFLVLLDMFSVSLVLPLLQNYYVFADVKPALREFVSSLYSASQIFGGLINGAMNDTGMLSRRGTLLLSFGGSAISYGLIGTTGSKGVGYAWVRICFSRILVGLVKQTFTASTAILSTHTTNENRTTELGRLQAGSTFAWIVGPTVGALLYKHVSPSAPAYVASMLFVINLIVAYVLLPCELEDDRYGKVTGDCNGDEVVEQEQVGNRGRIRIFIANVRACFTSQALASVVCATLLYSWVTRATSVNSIPRYYEDMYGIEPHQRGFISSYLYVLSFIVQTSLLRPLLRLLGGERIAACYASFGLSISYLIQAKLNLGGFICLVSPLVAIFGNLLSVSFKSLVTQVSPRESLGSALAALDVLQNIAAVSVPFYRTALFAGLSYLRNMSEDAQLGEGGSKKEQEVNPYQWAVSSSVHWFLLGVALYSIILRSQRSKFFRGGSSDKDEMMKDKLE